MADFSNDGVIQSIYNCGVVNNPNLDAGNYERFLANVIAPVIPRNERVSDQEMVGDGFSRTIRKLRTKYWTDGTFQINGLLNDHISPILLNAWNGGLVTVTPRTSPSKDIAAVMNILNSNPKLFSIFRKLGGERFLHSTLGVDTFEIAQEGENDPTANFNLKSTGHFLDADQLDEEEFDSADMTAAPDYEYFNGAWTEVTATDGVQPYNWTEDGSLISLAISGNNKVQTSRRPGDKSRDLTDRNTGSFARKIRNGVGPEAGIRLKVDLGSSLAEFKTMVKAKKLIGLKILFGGYNKISATTDFYEFEAKAPSSEFQLIEGDTDQDFGALALNIQPTRDSVTKGYFTNRVRTNKTLF